jgi:hypothetical protein
MELLCIFHDSEEYGVLRWPLKDIAQACGVPLKLLRELIDKGVLKGGDSGCAAYIYVPRHANKDGDPVEILKAVSGSPCWYCSRFVRDEYKRKHRGEGSRFSEENQPTKGKRKRRPKAAPDREPKPSPKGGIGDGAGDGASSSSSSSEIPPVVPEGDGADWLLVFPDRWRQIPRSDRKVRRVLCNNRLMERIGGWFGRMPDELWSLAEGMTLHELDPKPEQVETLEAYYLAEIHREHDYRRRELQTLLNNWSGEVDRARIWRAESA